ncbi:N-acetylneuraminate synthase family protein [Bacillus sp. SL00103]
MKLGAAMIEKHFTIDKTLPGADHSFALDPEELKKWFSIFERRKRRKPIRN